jgi:hypothetical protein
MRRVSMLAFAVLMMLVGIAPSHAEKRVALVIGNSSYRGMPPLPNPKNDATDMAAALHRVGFETILATNLDKRGMDDAFRRFARLARDAHAALFFYAGHGMQFAGTNYLMPVDAKLQDDADVPYELANVDDVIADLSRAKNIRIVILDACRDNPLAERLRMSLSTSRSAAVSRGLARIERSQGLITAFATQPGQVAADGVKTRNSPFTRALLKYIAVPGIEAGTMFRRVAQEVNQSTGGTQLPELSVSLLGEFYFAGQAPGSATLRAATPTNEAERAWAALGDTTTIAVLEEFIGRFGDSFYATLARARLDELRKSQVAMLTPPPAAVQPNVADTEQIIQNKCQTKYPQDFRMRAHCEKQQREALQSLASVKPQDIPEDQFLIVQKKCIGKYPDDFNMRAYCEKQQFKAIRELANRPQDELRKSQVAMLAQPPATVQPNAAAAANSGKAHEAHSVTPNSAPTINANEQQVIQSKCQADYPKDFNIQAYCEKQQREALQALALGRPQDIPENQFAIVRSKCQADYPKDFNMQAYCEKQQREALQALALGRPQDIPENQFAIVRSKCQADYPKDFNMQAYCEKQQFKAIRELAQRR